MTHCESQIRNRASFTLLELLVVVAIIGLLACAVVTGVAPGTGESAWGELSEQFEAISDGLADVRRRSQWQSTAQLRRSVDRCLAQFVELVGRTQQRPVRSRQFGYPPGLAIPPRVCPVARHVRLPGRRRDGVEPSMGNRLVSPRSRSYAMNGNFGGRGQEAQLVFWRENLSYDPTKGVCFHRRARG
jgi:prepilin-type N-terminal cleavage/methylation domain-containing protein